MKEINLLSSLLLIGHLAGSSAAQPSFPFVLFIGDGVPVVSISSPTCLFVATSHKFQISYVSFHERNEDGSTGSKVLLHEFVKYSDDQMVYFGMHCFNASTSSVLFHYDKAVQNIPFDSYKFREALFFFVSKTQWQAGCKDQGPLGGNVFYGVGSNDVILHKDCPAYFLIPSGIQGPFLDYDNCPVFDFGPVEENYKKSEEDGELEINISTVQHGVEPISKLAILNLSGDEIAKFDSDTILRNAVEIRSNSPSWAQKVLNVGTSFTEKTGDFCEVDRDFWGKTGTDFEGLIATDPLNPVNLEYKFWDIPSSIRLPFLEFFVEPYDQECANLTITFSIKDNPSQVEVNPNGSFNFSNPALTQVLATIKRFPSEACRLVDVRVHYSIQIIAEPPSTPPPTTPLGPISIEPASMPFMLYAGDEVTEITFKSSPCIFVKSSAEFNSSGVSLTAWDSQGTQKTSIMLSDFLHTLEDRFNTSWIRFGKHCFTEWTSKVSFSYGDAFEHVSLTSPKRRNAIFYFMKKSELARGNVYSGTINQTISLHSECPAVILSPSDYSNGQVASGDCPIVALYDQLETQPASLPSTLQLSISSVQSGLHPIDDLNLISVTGDQYPGLFGAEFLRPALQIASNLSQWLDHALPLQSFTYEVDSNPVPTCVVKQYWDFSADYKIGVFANDPWSQVAALHVFAVKFIEHPSYEFDIAPYALECFNVEIMYMFKDGHVVKDNRTTGLFSYSAKGIFELQVTITPKHLTPECERKTCRGHYLLKDVISTTTRCGTALSSTSSSSPPTPLTSTPNSSTFASTSTGTSSTLASLSATYSTTSATLMVKSTSIPDMSSSLASLSTTNSASSFTFTPPSTPSFSPTESTTRLPSSSTKSKSLIPISSSTTTFSSSTPTNIPSTTSHLSSSHPTSSETLLTLTTSFDPFRSDQNSCVNKYSLLMSALSLFVLMFLSL